MRFASALLFDFIQAIVDSCTPTLFLLFCSYLDFFLPSYFFLSEKFWNDYLVCCIFKCYAHSTSHWSPFQFFYVNVVPSGLLWQERTSILSIWKKSSVTYDGIMWIGSTPHHASRSLTKTPFWRLLNLVFANQMFNKHTVLNHTTETWKGHWSNIKVSACKRGAQNKLQSSYRFMCVCRYHFVYLLGVILCYHWASVEKFPSGNSGYCSSNPNGHPRGPLRNELTVRSSRRRARNFTLSSRNRERENKTESEKWECPEEGLDKGVGVSSLLLPEPNCLI